MKKIIAALKQFFSRKPIEQKTTHQKFSESVAAAVKKMREATPEQKEGLRKFEQSVRYHAAVAQKEFEELQRIASQSYRHIRYKEA